MNATSRLLGATIIAAALAATDASAHPPDAYGRHDDHHHIDPSRIRTWTNARTGELVRGAFLASRTVDGVVRVSIERETGDVVIFPLADLTDADRAAARQRIDDVKATNERIAAQALSQPSSSARPSAGANAPPQARPFNTFAPFVSTRWDDRWLYVESDGLPHVPGGMPGGFQLSHPMMVGITAWQQQVPLPQNYRGANAWRIPLEPELADTPVSAKEQLFRGAIALAANGVPIFNPIKNDGRTDTFLAGELDEFGGHCGRADDYHYHIAPTHLQALVGAGQPIAYALDGFPIHGLFDPAASPDGPDAGNRCPLGSSEPLDWMNGHHAPAPEGSPPGTRGLYHYHASVQYPYLNGGMRGKVTVKDDQIDPQPRASSPRAALPPLRGAKITAFKPLGEESEPGWSLQYMIAGRTHFVNYRLESGRWIFDFVDSAGETRTDTYDAASPPGRRVRDGGRGEVRASREPRGDGAGGRTRPPAPPRDADPPPAPGQDASGFTVSSIDVNNGRLSIDCTCDSTTTPRTPAIAWSNPPEGTTAFAVIMHHVTRDDDTHVYMVVADIPASARELGRGDTEVGTWGRNTVNRRNIYAPPCSQGRGDKSYTMTLYALSAAVRLRPDEPLTRDSLLAAITDTTLGMATLDMTYARTSNHVEDGDGR